MKLLTIAIPCYNSQDYMEKCVQSLLPGGEEVEILIVDDGSKDRTAEIADRLEKEHSGIVRASWMFYSPILYMKKKALPEKK